jgi:drug/metabolite transporter (DMT)-like permease
LYGWLLVTLLAAGLVVARSLAARLAANREPLRADPISWRRATVIGAFTWGAYLLVLAALSIAPLAIVAPVRETAVVAVAVWGVWKLHERSGAWLKLSGAVATLVGVALLAL